MSDGLAGYIPLLDMIDTTRFFFFVPTRGNITRLHEIRCGSRLREVVVAARLQQNRDRVQLDTIGQSVRTTAAAPQPPRVPNTQQPNWHTHTHTHTQACAYSCSDRLSFVTQNINFRITNLCPWPQDAFSFPPQETIDVEIVLEALEAVGVAAAAIDAVAERLIMMDTATVSWSDLHTAGVIGRDIVRARRHLAGPSVPAPPATSTERAAAVAAPHPSVEPGATGAVDSWTADSALVISTSSPTASHLAQVRERRPRS